MGEEGDQTEVTIGDNFSFTRSWESLELSVMSNCAEKALHVPCRGLRLWDRH